MDEKVKFVAGSCYIPKVNKSNPIGEDAHFICEEKQTIGVADGVGSWKERGVNAGEYARELMKNSIIALRTEFKGFVDQKRVLNSAYLATKVPGSSTACLLTLNGRNTLEATNVGDSGYMLIRKGLMYYKSPVQQHSFSRPYQLGRAISSDRPNIAVQTTLKVKEGDVIVAGTDGLFDNMYLEDISLLVRQGIKQGLDQQKIARTIADRAHQISLNKYNVTPFARASKESRFKHSGGKIDDITVIVAFFQPVAAAAV